MPEGEKKPSAEGRSPPQELEVGPRSGPYLLVYINWRKSSKLICGINGIITRAMEILKSLINYSACPDSDNSNCMAIWGLSKPMLIYLNLPEFTWIYLNLPEYTWIYLNIPEFTWIYLNLPEFTWIYLSLPEFTWIYLNLPDFTWIYLNSTEFT